MEVVDGSGNNNNGHTLKKYIASLSAEDKQLEPELPLDNYDELLLLDTDDFTRLRDKPPSTDLDQQQQDKRLAILSRVSDLQVTEQVQAEAEKYHLRDLARLGNGNGKSKAVVHGGVAGAAAAAAAVAKKEKRRSKSELKQERLQKEEQEYEQRIATIAKTISSFEEWQAKLIEKYNNLYTIVQNSLPGLWHSLEFDLSVKNILSIKDCSSPFAGIVLGRPSSLKTVGIDMLKGSRHTYHTFNFSPRAFVSHITGLEEEKLQKNDLLPKIRNKCLLTPELAPTFSAKDDDLLQFIGILTSILDGHGYSSDSGAHGHRGYDEDMMFTWIGAAVNIPFKVHKLLTTLGPKLYFLRVPKIEERTDDVFYKHLKDNNFEAKVHQIRQSLTKYEEWFAACPAMVYDDQFNSKIKKMPWISSDDDRDMDAYMHIIKLGKLLAHLRGVAPTWETKGTQGSEYGYTLPTIEEPDRAMKHLSNLAKGHALLTGRNYVDIEDIPLIIKVVLSTAPIERVTVLDVLLGKKGVLTVNDITQSLPMSEPTARKAMTEFKILGLADVKLEERVSDDGIRRPTLVMRLKDEFSYFLSEEFKKLRDGYKPERPEPKSEAEAEAMKEKYPLEGSNNKNSNNENSSTLDSDLSRSDNSDNNNDASLSRGENSFTASPTTTTTTTSKAHDPWFAYSSGIWHCNNCNASGDRFFIEETRCKGPKK